MSDEETTAEGLKRMEGETVKETTAESGGVLRGVTVIKIETEIVELIVEDGEVRLRYWY